MEFDHSVEVIVSDPAQARFYEGVRAGLPFMVVVLPFGLLFGVMAMDAGLALGQTIGMSVLVIAGASQFAAVQLLSENAGLALILMAALTVNLRMAMYSAALVPYMGEAPLWKRALVSYLNFDQTYAVAVAKYAEQPDWCAHQRAQFFFGVATPIVPAWALSTVVGACVGHAIPAEWGLDFILPVTFIALFGPLLRSLPHIAAALVSVCVGLALAGLPAGVGLICAAVAAMLTGALVEQWLDRRRGGA